MNPLFNSGNSSSNQATAPSNVANQATPAVRRSFNRFNNSYAHYTSALYGEYVPFYVQEVNPTDSKKFKSKIQVRTDTLISPLYSNVKMNKDYFFVPFDALLPFNWEKIYKNPSQGDDVPDDASFSSRTFYLQVGNLVNKFIQYFAQFNSLSEYGKGLLLLMLPLMDDLFSTSGSFSRMRCPLSHLARFKYKSSSSSVSFISVSWDRLMERMLPLIFKDGTSWSLMLSPSDTLPVVLTIDNAVTSRHMDISVSSSVRTGKVTSKTMISILRYFSGSFINESSMAAFGDISITDDSDFVLSSLNVDWTFNGSSSSQDGVLDYSRFAAYSMCCAQFYSNGQVDSVFSAQLYRDLLSSYVNDFYLSVVDSPVSSFVYNGVKTPYDWLSAHYFDKAFGVLFAGIGSANETFASVQHLLSALMYLRSIFDLHNCIKYGDYFTGAHTRPLAIGDISAPVVGSSVSAIDMTKALLYQKFLNVVVKLKNDISDYLKTIFGTLPAPDYHEAKFVSHSEGQLSGFEVANTADDQGNLCSLLHEVNENFEFDLQCNQAGVCLGILSFVSSRAYCMTSDRQCHYSDRYDMYNPMLQGLGDQSILSVEKSGLHPVPFAYQSRYGELKQRTNYASGAFIDKLRSFCIISDSPYIDSNCLEVLSPTLSPVYIRLLPTEFNRFIKQSGSWSYGNDYHFIVEVNNDVDDVLEMEYSPNTL